MNAPGFMYRKLARMRNAMTCANGRLERHQRQLEQAAQRCNNLCTDIAKLKELIVLAESGIKPPPEPTELPVVEPHHVAESEAPIFSAVQVITDQRQ